MIGILSRSSLMRCPATVSKSCLHLRRAHFCTSASSVPPCKVEQPFPRIRPLIHLQEEGEAESRLMCKMYKWIKIAIVEVKLPPHQTLIYRQRDLDRFPFRLSFGEPDIVKSGYYVPVTPLLQVFSVTVHPDLDEEGPLQIYGSIKATDGRGNTSKLYDRDPAHPETSTSLSLVGTDGDAMSYYVDTATTMDLCLKDKSQDIEVEGQLVLHPETEDIDNSFDRLRKGVVLGKNGYASVYYSTFRVGVFALVHVAIFDSSRPSANVYGTIVATYSNHKNYYTSDDEIKCMKTTLFNKSSDTSVPLMVASPIPLSRCVVAVPAYSSLVIGLDLWDSFGQLTKASPAFAPLNGGNQSELIEGRGGLIVVDVSWHIGDHERCFEVQDDGDTKREDEPRKLPQNLNDQHFSASSLSAMRMRSFMSSASYSQKSLPEGSLLAEVFTVLICGIAQEVSQLCGTISVDSRSSFYLYNRDKSNPEYLSPGNSIASIECHSVVGQSDCCISFDLWDPVQDLNISSGYLTWCPVTVRRYGGIEERECAVIRGAQGYAVMHYTVFDDAFAATVEVTFSITNAAIAHAMVYGSLFARYGSYDYSTVYVEKYFRSRLFSKAESEAVQLGECSRVPLSKSVVAVPSNSSLLIECDMFVGILEDEVLRGKTEFEIDLSQTVRQEIRGKHYCLEVSVKFDR